MRIGSAFSQQTSIDQLAARQAQIARLQDQISSGQKLQRASEDPGAAARAERARTALARIDADQRGLQGQRSAMQLAESSLGQSTDLLQRARELLVQAQGGTLNASDRQSIASELTGIREQLLNTANQRDANGVPLFGGLSVSGSPFVDTGAGVQFVGQPGQTLASDSAVPGSMDGSRVWMNMRTGNGVFQVTPDQPTTGGAWLDAGEVVDPTALTGLLAGDTFNVSFSVTGGVTTATVNQSGATPPTILTQTINPSDPNGTTLTFGGMSVQVKGVPTNGESFTIQSSQPTDLFAMLDRAVSALSTGGQPSARVNGALTRALREVDLGMDRVSQARTAAGNWLQRVDLIESTQQAKSTNIEQERAQTEDIDLTRSVSDLQSSSGALDVALKSYAQIQRISLFNYLSGG